MKRAVWAIIFFCLFAVSCTRFLPEEDIPDSGDIRELGMPENITDEFSYVFGYMLASSASEYGQNIDYEYMARGVLDYSSGKAFYADSEMNRILTLHQRHMITMDLKAEEELSESNRESAWAFLIANGKRRSVVTLPSGLEYEILKEGDGESAENALVVAGEYQMSLPDGSIAYSTYENGVLDEIVLSGFVTACLFAVSPTSLSPFFAKPTTDGVVLAPSVFAITVGCPPSITATQLFVVPKSIPMILPIMNSS